ncbi:class I SAM-dependent methyltransferase [Sporosarcina sp. CAU 1771]
MTNHWDQKFSREEYIFGKEPNEFIVQATEHLPKGKILCIAEGEGRNAVYLASLGHDVTTWDYSKIGLEKTKRLADEKGVTLKIELRDLEHVVWDEEEWDAIVHVFGHFPTEILGRTLAGVNKALKPGGYYISELYTKEQLKYGTGGPGKLELLIDPKQMLSAFSDSFVKHFHIGEVNREEGLNHTGTAHVVQCQFQKR